MLLIGYFHQKKWTTFISTWSLNHKAGIHAPLVASWRKIFSLVLVRFGAVRDFQTFVVLVWWGPEISKSRTAPNRTRTNKKILRQLAPTGAWIPVPGKSTLLWRTALSVHSKIQILEFRSSRDNQLVPCVPFIWWNVLMNTRFRTD